MKNLRIYDNGGQTFDRYTVVFMDRPERAPGTYEALAASEYPFSPMGFGQHVMAMPGRHLGRPIRFESLPEDVRRFVNQNLED